MWTWETGVEFGRAIEQLRHHELRLGATEVAVQKVEQGHSALKEEVHSLKAMVIRGGLLALLWAAGIAANLPADRVGEFTATFLKTLSK